MSSKTFDAPSQRPSTQGPNNVRGGRAHRCEKTRAEAAYGTPQSPLCPRIEKDLEARNESDAGVLWCGRVLLNVERWMQNAMRRGKPQAWTNQGEA